MIAVIDGDPLAYIIGFGHNDLPLWYQCQKLDEFVQDIIQSTEADSIEMYLTGKGNFREEVATILPYKGNRNSDHKPRFQKELREYMMNVWDAELIEGMEADDACGISCYNYDNQSIDRVVCTIDKDLKMIGGNFYDYKRREYSQISEEEAWRFFFTQILTGDSSDNIPGLFKITGSKATKKIKEGLLGLDNPNEMASYVRDTYLGKDAKIEDVIEIGTLLWMRQTPDGGELDGYFREWGWRECTD